MLVVVLPMKFEAGLIDLLSASGMDGDEESAALMR
jgi:hypothetical protein